MPRLLLMGQHLRLWHGRWNKLWGEVPIYVGNLWSFIFPVRLHWALTFLNRGFPSGAWPPSLIYRGIHILASGDIGTLFGLLPLLFPYLSGIWIFFFCWMGPGILRNITVISPVRIYLDLPSPHWKFPVCFCYVVQLRVCTWRRIMGVLRYSIGLSSRLFIVVTIHNFCDLLMLFRLPLKLSSILMPLSRSCYFLCTWLWFAALLGVIFLGLVWYVCVNRYLGRAMLNNNGMVFPSLSQQMLNP